MKYVVRSIYIFLCTFAALLCFAATPADGTAHEQPLSLRITAGDKTYVYSDEKIEPSDFTVAEEIETRRINASLGEKMLLVDTCLARGADHKTALRVCFPRLIMLTDCIADKMYVPAENAEVTYVKGKFQVKLERAGVKLDESKLYASLYCCIKFSGGGEVKAYTQRIDPEITSEMLTSNLKLRGRYTTDFSRSTEARAHNVKLALSKFDGAVVPSGQTLSFNGTVGPRTEKNGFRSAKIIVNGEYTDGVGGGVCQASTAVYNAALIAGMSCYANAHSICPSYCPPGLDAMISSVSDLLVTNVTNHPVYISVSVNGGKATVSFYGERNEYKIVPESVTVKTVPYETKEFNDTGRKYFDGEYVSGDRRLVSVGKEGVVSNTYLNYYASGKQVKRVHIRTNEYKTLPQVIAVAP